ncbi:cuticle protein 7-like, partial [Ostrinia furnacalis]|uniref:cuticle protein 7-like n=1 Tax=Ostrinia furnacalis TaxID=93504 RepID=UPI00103F6A27
IVHHDLGHHGHHGLGHIGHHAHHIGHAVHLGYAHGHGHHDYHAHPEYSFSYSVKDPHTGDHKQQHESRHGDSVKGEYSLVEPDGNVRSVHYNANDHTGFNAVVHHKTHHVHPHHIHHHGHH